jgi:hypothetical protein
MPQAGNTQESAPLEIARWNLQESRCRHEFLLVNTILDLRFPEDYCARNLHRAARALAGCVM